VNAWPPVLLTGFPSTCLFDASLLRRTHRSQGAFLRPGEPFFEGLCDEIIERFRVDTQRGVVYRDPTADSPYGLPSTYARSESLQT